MAADFSAQLLASVLEQLRREKEVHIREEQEREQLSIRAEEEAAQRALEDAKRRRGELEQHSVKDREKLEELANAARAAAETAAEEARVGALAARMQDFRGSGDVAIRERMLAEGFSEAATENQLHLRTLDQQLTNEFGMRAAFTRFGDENPAGQEGKSGPAVAAEEQSLSYLRTEGQENLYRSGGPGSGDDEDVRRRDKEEGVRKSLGLDIDLGLGYGRAK